MSNLSNLEELRLAAFNAITARHAGGAVSMPAHLKETDDLLDWIRRPAPLGTVPVTRPVIPAAKHPHGNDGLSTRR